MRFSRGCYDKFHRCPGWNGGGPHFAKTQRCDGGYIQASGRRLWEWRFARCNKCSVVVWPYMTRYLSVPYLLYRLRWWWRNRDL